MPIAISWQGATLGANTFTGAQVAPSLALGGTTSSYPSLIRNGVTLQVRLADNSDDASLSAASFTLGNAGLAVSWSGRSQIKSPADGNLLLLNNAANDFTRLQFGGTGPTYPAIARSGTTLKFRTADDSADAPITAAAATFSGALTVPGVTTAALTSTGTFTSGAGAQVGTLTNAPAAGNPTTWVKIVDNGVTRYIPAW